MQARFVAEDGTPIPVERDAVSRFVDGEAIASHGFFRDIRKRPRASAEENACLEREQQAR